MPLISQDLMLYPLFLFGKVLGDIHFYTHAYKICVFYKTKVENVSILLHNGPYILVKSCKIYFSLNSVAEKKGDICWWTYTLKIAFGKPRTIFFLICQKIPYSIKLSTRMIKSLQNHGDNYASAPFILFPFYFYVELLFFIVLNLESR